MPRRARGRGPRSAPAVTCRLVVGCDGGRSAARALTGVDFVGTEPLLTGCVARSSSTAPTRRSCRSEAT
ncbi:FAD-dependent monooxygenase [Streptomyces sp. NPDC049954]|uniref:FAD-dependent monooxygenase n=1 Tax=Streptomyces sp. NPDC049954 TaxID=3155779 RepID=UPI003444033B